MSGRLPGKVAVITGGASGIGLASAQLFAREGADIAIVDRDISKLPPSELNNAKNGALLLEGDVGDEAIVGSHAAAVAERFGGFDILLACAGWSTGKGVLETSLDEWEGVLRTNLTGSFLWSRAAIRSMRERGGGSIILVGSQLAFAGGRANAPYLASKGAVTSLARCMAVDHAVDGIRVNTVVPGAIQTPLIETSLRRTNDPAGARKRSVARHPLGRFGTADEVARAALFLASDESSFTTGSCLMTDGGWLAG